MPEKRRDARGRILREGEVQRPDGKYMFRYTDSSGKRRAVYSWKLVSTDKLKEGQRGEQSLRDKEKKILRDLDDGLKTCDATRITVDDLFRQFMDIRKDLKESSRCCYINIYNGHIKPVLGSRAIGTIKPTDIQKLYQNMVTTDGVSPTTAQKAHSVVYQIFENAVVDNIIRTNPAANAFRSFRKTANLEAAAKEPLTVEQQAIFIDYVYHSGQYKRLANLFTVLLGTGMRISEALGLRWCDCDFENGVIHITHILLYKEGEGGGYRYRISSPKSESGCREIPMLEDVKAALHAEKAKRCKPKKEFVVDGYSDFVFLNNAGQVYTQSFIYDALQNIVMSYNRREYAKAHDENRQPVYLPKMSAHTFRHTFCTRMCENDVNIKVLQDIMGHKNIQTTMEIYAKAMREKKIEVMSGLNGAFKIR